jgi:hypothetical protein
MMSTLSAKLGDLSRTVAYEELVTNPSTVVNSLWQWLGIIPPDNAKFEIVNDVDCSVPYRDFIAAELDGKTI